MPIASPSEPPRRVTPQRGALTWIVLAPLWVLSGSCVFDLPPLEGGIGGAGDSGFGNVGGALPAGGGGTFAGLGGMGIGGSAGVTDPGGCEEGQKRCATGECLPATPLYGCASSACQPCGSAPGTEVACVEGQCTVTGCAPGLADCNGDVINSVGQISGDGCEYSFGPSASPVTTLGVPFANILVDGKRDDWSGLPSYELAGLCKDCIDNNTEAISEDSTVPPRNDLDARFRVAWNGDKFYVLVEAFDNQLYDTGVTAGGRCQQAANCEDAVQVFFAGRNDPTHGYFNDNMRVFLGLSERVGAPAQGQPATGDVEIKRERQGNLCYRIEAQVDWAYITNTKSNPTSAPDFFPAAPGNIYGFDVAVSDWDAPISDANSIQRQSQIFWVGPGPEYGTKPDGIGTMQLLGGSDAGQ